MAAASNQTIHVQDLDGLLRAFGRADKTIRDDLKDALLESAQPVRAAAQSLASARIRNVGVGSPWSRMRVGVARSVVYVAPVERGVKSRGMAQRKRRKFADLLMDRAMAPALEQNREKVIARFEQLLDDVADVWEKAHG